MPNFVYTHVTVFPVTWCLRGIIHRFFYKLVEQQVLLSTRGITVHEHLSCSTQFIISYIYFLSVINLTFPNRLASMLQYFFVEHS